MREASSGSDQRLSLSEADIERVVQQGYGLTVVEQRRLGGEVDQNVWIKTDDSREFLFKGSAGTIDSSLLWQEKVLSHLATTAPQLPVPRLIPARSGAAMLAVEIGGLSVVTRLLTWMPGKMMADVAEPPDYLLYDLGVVAGRLTQALADLEVGDFDESHHWDIRKSREAVDEALAFVSDEADRWAVSALIRRFDEVIPDLGQLPSGVVHHDLNDFNVLAAPDRDDRWVITGVIDVNDSMFTIRVAELAIAVAYAMLRQEDPLHAAVTVVAGFNSVVPLDDREIKVVFPLAGARLCVNATTWTRRTIEAHHPYGKERMRHTWPTLRKLAEISTDEAEARMRTACRLPANEAETSEV
jgi:Ser/Thr protein kinase RdoA (MazF antagonist)